MTRRLTPVVLCGGEGRRLWPLSRAERPKPLMALAGAGTALAETLARVADANLFAPAIVVCGAASAREIAQEIAALGHPASLVVEPAPRNTAPAVAVAAAIAAGRDPATPLLVLPADHRVDGPDAFLAALAAGAHAVRDGRIVVFGVAPTWPSPGFGYVRAGARLFAEAEAFALDGFREKPQAAEAAAMIGEGWLWNSGMFLMSAARALGELAERQPAILRAVRESLDGAGTHGQAVVLGEAFAGAPDISFDHAVMEGCANAAVVPARFGWSDLGTWASVWEAGSPDAAGNVVRGPAVAENASNALIVSEGVPTAVVGLDDVVVVVTRQGVLVSRRDSVDRVKDLSEALSTERRGDEPAGG